MLHHRSVLEKLDGSKSTVAVSDSIEWDDEIREEEPVLPVAAFTRLSRRVIRPGVLRPGLQHTEIPEPVLTGLRLRL